MDSSIRIFGDLGIEDAIKRKLASRQLQDKDMEWWNSVTLETPDEEISWEPIQAKFEAKIISTAHKSALFMKLLEMK